MLHLSKTVTHLAIKERGHVDTSPRVNKQRLMKSIHYHCEYVTNTIFYKTGYSLHQDEHFRRHWMQQSLHPQLTLFDIAQPRDFQKPVDKRNGHLHHRSSCRSCTSLH
jgi:hypothetical protein